MILPTLIPAKLLRLVRLASMTLMTLLSVCDRAIAGRKRGGEGEVEYEDDEGFSKCAGTYVDWDWEWDIDGAGGWNGDRLDRLCVKAGCSVEPNA